MLHEINKKNVDKQDNTHFMKVSILYDSKIMFSYDDSRV